MDSRLGLREHSADIIFQSLEPMTMMDLSNVRNLDLLIGMVGRVALMPRLSL